MKEWYSPQEIRFTSDQCIFLISNIQMLREGQYPPECRETGYSGIGSQPVGHHAPFEIPVGFAAEIDYRLEKIGKDGLLLVAEVLADLPLHYDARLALWYCSGFRRKVMSYNDWCRQLTYRHRVKTRALMTTKTYSLVNT